MKNKNTLSRVTMEPDVEAFAALWPALKRIRMGKKLKRWGHQLCFSGKLMIDDDVRHRRVRKPVLRFVAVRKAALN